MAGKTKSRLLKNKPQPAPQEVPQVELNKSPAAEPQQPQSATQQASNVESIVQAPVTEAPHDETAAEAHEEETKEQFTSNVSPESTVSDENNNVDENQATLPEAPLTETVAANGDEAQPSTSEDLAHGDANIITEENKKQASSENAELDQTPVSVNVNMTVAENKNSLTAHDSVKNNNGKTGFTPKQCLTQLKKVIKNFADELPNNTCLPVYLDACKEDTNSNSALTLPKAAQYKLNGFNNKDDFCKKVESTAKVIGLIQQEPVLQLDPEKPLETGPNNSFPCLTHLFTNSVKWITDKGLSDQFATELYHGLKEDEKVKPECLVFYKKLCEDKSLSKDQLSYFNKPEALINNIDEFCANKIGLIQEQLDLL